MADCTEILTVEEIKNWAKCSYAVQITRLGLLDFCKYEIEKFHLSIITGLRQGTACNQCTVSDVIPYSRPGHGCRPGQCRCPSIPCALGVCDNIRNLVEKEHRYNQIYWKSTNMADWFLCPWEIAKCFLQEVDYKDKNTPEFTDFNSIISLIKNNRRFAKLYSFPNLEAICERVSVFKCKSIFHRIIIIV